MNASTATDREVQRQVQPTSPIQSAAALLIKELIWRYLVKFEPTKRPIFLYASRRSGSSLLMEVICANRAVMFSDQPFGLYTASSATINQLPLYPGGQIVDPDAQESSVLELFVRRLLDGKIKANAPWKLWNSVSHFRNDRICLKITDAKSIADWLDERFDNHTIVMTRHPLAQAVSVENAGWFGTGSWLLQNRRYTARWLDDALVAYAQHIYGEGPPLARRVLDWTLENLPLLRMLPENPHWLFVSYEDLVLFPREVIERLASFADLNDQDRMLERTTRPSRSTAKISTRERLQAIRRQDQSALLHSWRSRVDAATQEACTEILDRFGIDLYRMEAAVPDHSVLGRTAFVERTS